ncbi:alpha/beta hydrolase [Leifsonia sp. NPDC058230]|uniref:alpha/beta hydrolase n=1 Tax=Leifsonia sp. NPDC058230 TaxID=3346391 RepID=UPI0036DA98E2
MNDPDIDRMRREAAARASARPRLPFSGTVTDETVGSVPVRWYTPETDARPDTGVVFLHGGYGVLGDLDLQDGYCRRIASILRTTVLSVGYRLAPEADLTESAADAVEGVAALRDAGVRDVVLWGDSAGGALAIVTARQARAAALVLTNPNVDLTVSGFDPEATGGPGRELSEWAFARWAGRGRLQDAPDLAADVRGLPPAFVAVGSTDSLLPDSRRFVQQCREAGVRAELHVVPGASHGFMGGPDVTTIADVIQRAGAFIGSDPAA